MTAHPSLFELPPIPRARHTDPDTSHQAARSARPRARFNRQRVLEALMDAGEHGLTDHELAARLGGQQTSLGVRRGELVKLGLVEDAHRTRPAPSGSAAKVWRIARGPRFETVATGEYL